MGGVSLGDMEKEKTAWEQEAQMPIIQGMGTKGMAGEGTNGERRKCSYLLSYCFLEFGSWVC